MKRDKDYVREMLLSFEASESDLITHPNLASRGSGQDPEMRKKIHHMDLALDAGLIVQTGKGTYRLTNDGHDFLDAIRDEGIWSETKKKVAEAGGNATLEIVKSLAKGFLKKKIQQHTDIEL